MTRILVYELNTDQVVAVEFEDCSFEKVMLNTCMSSPDDYPAAEVEIGHKTHKVQLAGYKCSTGKSVFIMANGTFITDELKRVKDITSVVWRLRLERA